MDGVLRCELSPVGGDWATVRAKLEQPGWTWVWTDLTGLVVDGGLPADPPITTCVWGWRPGSWTRLRVDREPGGAARVIGAVLTQDTEGRYEVVQSIRSPWWSSSSRGSGLDRLRTVVVRTLHVKDPELTFVELVPRSCDEGLTIVEIDS